MANLPSFKFFSKQKLLSAKATFAKKVAYTPSAGQAMVHRSNSRFRVVCAGARYGKSMLAGFEMAFYLLFPDVRIWAVAPVYELADKEFNWALEFLSRYKLPDGRNILDIGRLNNPTRGSRSFILPTGSYMRTKSTEKPDTLLGEEVDLIVLCEASKIPREVWERQLRARLGPRQGSLLVPSTGSGDSGLFVEMVEKGKDDSLEFQDWESWEFSTSENPTFSKEEYQRAKESLPPEIFAEQYEGKLVSRRGFVFPLSYSHLYEPSENFESLPVIVSMQYSFKNSCVVAFIVSPRPNEIFVMDELYLKETLIEDVVKLIREKIKGKRIHSFITDYWDVETIHSLQKIGIRVDTVNEKTFGRSQAIISRVRAVQSVLKYDELLESPRLRFSPKCVNILEEFRKCKWQDKQKELADKLEVEIPLQKYFQAPQAISHAVALYEMINGVDIYSPQKQKKGEEE